MRPPYDDDIISDQIRDVGGARNELIDLTERGVVEIEELTYDNKENHGEEITFFEKGNLEFECLQYDKKTRRAGFFVLIGAFVVAMLACEAFGMVTNNEKLIEEVLSLFKTIILLVIGYYFAKKD